MQKELATAHSVKWGIIIGLIYCVLLWLRYSQGATQPILLGMFTLAGYLIVLILLLVSGFQLRSKLGGYIEFREIFKYLFITVIIFELFYNLFNFIYLKYVDPDFFQKLRDATETFMMENNVPQKDIDEMNEKLQGEADANTRIGSVVKTLLISIAVSGTFALIFSAIIKRRKDPFLNEQENTIQAQ